MNYKHKKIPNKLNLTQMNSNTI